MNLYKPRAYKQQFTHTVFRIPHCFKLTAISLRFALQPFTISWGKLPLFQTVFCFPSGVEIVGFNCSLFSFYPCPPQSHNHCKKETLQNTSILRHVTLSNFRCNLFVTQVTRKITSCHRHVESAKSLSVHTFLELGQEDQAQASALPQDCLFQLLYSQ